MSHGWKEDSMLVKRLAAYTHLSSTISEIASYWSKIATFLYPTSVYRPSRGWPRRNFVKIFDAGKTRMTTLWWKNYDDILSRFHTIPACHGQTDRRTDRQNCYINIARQCADAR